MTFQKEGEGVAGQYSRQRNSFGGGRGASGKQGPRAFRELKVSYALGRRWVRGLPEETGNACKGEILCSLANSAQFRIQARSGIKEVKKLLR